MPANGHNPVSFVNDLGAKLATRSRHVCVFMGAGVGKACGLPDLEDLKQLVLSGLDCERRSALERQLQDHNLEEALSRMRRIAALVSGEDTVDGLNAAQAKALDEAICRQIVKSLSVESADKSSVICLAAWAARANYLLPVELFTVNYDLLLEEALEEMHVPYFDGFVGVLQARFQTELVEADPQADPGAMPAFLVRLWKLHGSVNWTWNSSNRIVRLGQEAPGSSAAAIYPSDAKYEESRRVPFVVLQDRFRRALHHPETLMLITGYSFGDEHLNEQIFDAATRRERSEFIVFSYSSIPGPLAERAEITPNLQVVAAREAIIGGIRCNWEESDHSPPNIWCDGEFLLRDFRCLARYLARSMAYRQEGDRILQALLERAMEGDDFRSGGSEDVR